MMFSNSRRVANSLPARRTAIRFAGMLALIFVLGVMQQTMSPQSNQKPHLRRLFVGVRAEVERTTSAPVTSAENGSTTSEASSDTEPASVETTTSAPSTTAADATTSADVTTSADATTSAPSASSTSADSTTPPDGSSSDDDIPAADDWFVMFSKGYGNSDKVRVSVVAKASIGNPGLSGAEGGEWPQDMNYGKWDMHTYSKVVTVSGGSHTETVDGKEFTVKLPSSSDGIYGMFIADPNISADPQWSDADWSAHFAEGYYHISSFSDLDVTGILGDNFYENQWGIPANGGTVFDFGMKFMSNRSTASQSKLMMMVDGNHDWDQNGNPQSEACNLCGYSSLNGFPMDTYALKDDSKWTTKPAAVKRDALVSAAAPVDRFFFMNTVGNTAFIGYSSTDTWEAQQDMFKDACSQAKEAGSEFLVVLNHYNGCDMGCTDQMESRSVAAKLQTLDGCSDFGNKITWYEGHDHRNAPVTNGSIWGMDVSAYGMHADYNKGTFYIFSTKDGAYKVYEFQKDAIMNCTSVEDCISKKQYTALYDDSCHTDNLASPNKCT